MYYGLLGKGTQINAVKTFFFNIMESITLRVGIACKNQ